MELDRGETEFFGNLSVLDLTSFIKAQTTDTFSHETAAGNGRTAAKSLELNIGNLASNIIHFNLKLHNITTSRSTDETGANRRVHLIHGTNISWSFVVVNDLWEPK